MKLPLTAILSAAAFWLLANSGLAQTSSLLLETRFNDLGGIELKNGANLGPEASGPSGRPGDHCYLASLAGVDLESQQAGPAAVLDTNKEMQNVQEMTVTLWYKGSPDPDKGGMLLQGYGWNISREGERLNIWLYHNKETNSRIYSKSSGVWTGADWIFLVLTWSNADQRISFLRGSTTQAVSLESESGVGPYPEGISQDTTVGVAVGNNSINYHSSFEGSIDNVRVFNRLLTTDEMEAVRQADGKDEPLK